MTSLEKLKELFQRQTRREVLSCSLLPSGLPKGAITEVSGFGKTELVTRFLAEHEDIRVAWIEETFSVFPFAFQQRRVDLKRVLFVEAGDDLPWAALQILKAQIFGIVVLYAETLNLTQLRRLQLAAEKSNASVLWLTHHPQSLWPVNVQLHVQKAAEGFHVDVLRQRY